MDYQVWIKEEFGDTYKKVDCVDLAAAKRQIDEAVRAGGDPILTVEVPYKLDIKVEAVGTEKPKQSADTRELSKKGEEAPKSEADQVESEPGKGPGAKGKGQV